MGSEVCDQQLGCLWQGEHLISISLSGFINYLDKNNPNKPLRVVKVSVSSTGETTITVSPAVLHWEHALSLCVWFV